jgi:hypothetical protein
MAKNHQQFLLAQEQQRRVISEAAKNTSIPKEALKIYAGSVHPGSVSHRRVVIKNNGTIVPRR